MQATQSINVRFAEPWLAGCEHNVYTQFGEDGLVEAVLSRIGITNRWCFEIGAHDGEFYSNTLRLREVGWNAVLMEKEPEHWQRCYEKYSSDSVQCLFGEITDLDHALRFSRMAECLLPDFGVIDIDGQDYWLWQSLIQYRPRVMLVEICPNEWDPPPPRGQPGQAGLAAIRTLGEAKGYQCVAATYCNALFVTTEELKNV